MLLAGLVLGAGAVWLVERYHERKRDELMHVLGQTQMQVDELRLRMAQLEEPPIPEEEL